MKVLSILSFVAAVSALAVRQTDVAADLKGLVTSPASVSVELRARWSDYNSPLPAVVVKVQAEKDIAVIVSSAGQSSASWKAKLTTSGQILHQTRGTVPCSKWRHWMGKDL